MITAEQIRAARALLKIEQGELAERAGISHGTIKRLEGLTGSINAQEATLSSIKRALESSGVIFIDEDAPSANGGAGVRLAESSAIDKWNATVATILDALVDSLEMAVEDRGMKSAEMSEAILEARQEAYDLLERNARDQNTPDLFHQDAIDHALSLSKSIHESEPDKPVYARPKRMAIKRSLHDDE